MATLTWRRACWFSATTTAVWRRAAAFTASTISVSWRMMPFRAATTSSRSFLLALLPNRLLRWALAASYWRTRASRCSMSGGSGSGGAGAVVWAKAGKPAKANSRRNRRFIMPQRWQAAGFPTYLPQLRPVLPARLPVVLLHGEVGRVSRFAQPGARAQVVGQGIIIDDAVGVIRRKSQAVSRYQLLSGRVGGHERPEIVAHRRLVVQVPVVVLAVDVALGHRAPQGRGRFHGHQIQPEKLVHKPAYVHRHQDDQKQLPPQAQRLAESSLAAEAGAVQHGCVMIYFARRAQSLGAPIHTYARRP